MLAACGSPSTKNVTSNSTWVAVIALTGFVGSYRDLASLEPGAPVVAQELGTQVLRLPLTAASNAEATAKGVEAAIRAGILGRD